MRSTVIFILFIYATVKINLFHAKIGRIIGGQVSDITKHPYQVSLQYYGKHRCGGAIISDIWVLTAAHCVHGRNDRFFTIRAGSSAHDKDGSVHNVTIIIAHTQYNTSNFDNDIAILTVSPRLEIGTSHVDNITLATERDRVSPGDYAVVSGWGFYDDLGVRRIPQLLRAASVRIVGKRMCTRLLKPRPITESMLCAGILKGGEDACQGDSGGPLVISDILIGLVSFGDGCAKANKSGVYSNIAYLRPWIANSSGV